MHLPPSSGCTALRSLPTLIPHTYPAPLSLPQVRALANGYGLPVLGTSMGRGLLPDEHPLCVNAARWERWVGARITALRRAGMGEMGAAVLKSRYVCRSQAKDACAIWPVAKEMGPHVSLPPPPPPPPPSSQVSGPGRSRRGAGGGCEAQLAAALWRGEGRE